MQYRKDKYGQELSILGFGCMRFTRKGTSIDIDKAESEIMAAYRAGVNYYDTAYIYPGSEEALGEILERNGIRDKVNIATKLPQYLIRDRASVDKYFNEELSRLRTDRIDYYLMHMLTDMDMWEKLKSAGIIEWIDEKKKCGQIRNIGFSFHGNTDSFKAILDDYDWDFCQIQYNYMDENTQAGVTGLKAAAKRGIPVIIMEPLRGGKLVNMLPAEARRIIKDGKRKWSPATWSFAWLYNQPEVTVVLSGMNSIKMVRQNCKTASHIKAGSFTEDDFRLIDKVKSAIRRKEKVGCTGCRYCMPCPKGVDIPGTFACWNTMYTENKLSGLRQYAQAVSLTKEPVFASQCVECGKCEKHCPQKIPIRQKLKEADKDLLPLPFKWGINAARWFMFKRNR